MKWLLPAAAAAAVVAASGSAAAPPDYDVAFARTKPRAGKIWQYAVFSVGDSVSRWTFDYAATLGRNRALRPRKHVFFVTTPDGRSRAAGLTCSFRIPRGSGGRRVETGWTATLEVPEGREVRQVIIDGVVCRWRVARR